MTTPSTKPYLLRAIYEWCCDNGFTPYVAVLVDTRTRVPMEFVRDGQIVLNIGPDATNRLQMGNELITFQARFGGVARDLSMPVGNVVAIYARENGVGMAFEPEPEDEAAADMDGGAAPEMPQAPEAPKAPSADAEPEPPPPSGGRPRLQRVK